MTIHVLNKYEESIPVAYCIVEEENKDAAEALLRTLNRLAPEGIAKVKGGLSDMANAYLSAWKKEIGTPIRWIACMHILG